MAHQFRTAFIDNSDPRAIADAWDFPDGAQALAFTHPGAGSTLADGKTKDAQTLTIWGSGAPSTNYNNAPNGSVYIDYTNAAIYIKTGKPGSGTAGTWTTVNS